MTIEQKIIGSPRRRIGSAGNRPQEASLKNRVPQEIEDAIVALAIEQLWNRKHVDAHGKSLC